MTVLCVTPEPQTHSHTSSPLHSLVHRPTTVLSCCFVWRMIQQTTHQEGEGTVPVTTAEQSPCCSKLNSRHDAAKSSHHDRSTAPQRWWVCPKVGVCWSWTHSLSKGRVLSNSPPGCIFLSRGLRVAGPHHHKKGSACTEKNWLDTHAAVSAQRASNTSAEPGEASPPPVRTRCFDA
jgi:hypothetical protein